jgi:hypothetical protein
MYDVLLVRLNSDYRSIQTTLHKLESSRRQLFLLLINKNGLKKRLVSSVKPQMCIQLKSKLYFFYISRKNVCTFLTGGFHNCLHYS